MTSPFAPDQEPAPSDAHPWDVRLPDEPPTAAPVRPAVPPLLPPAQTYAVWGTSPSDQSSRPTSSAARSRPPKAKHPASRARRVVAGTATAATVVLIGGFALSAPADTTVSTDTDYDQSVVPGAGVDPTTPTTSAPTTTAPRSSRGRTRSSTPSTVTPSTTTPRATPPTTVPQSRPRTRSRGS